MPSFEYEKKLLKELPNNIGTIASGADEVGRGCLAGPVVACCTVIKNNIPQTLLQEIDDSKTLSAKKRENIAKNIKEYIYYKIVEVSVQEIDKINILQASLLAIKYAYNNLKQEIQPNILLLDGNKNVSLDIPSFPIVKGDSKSFTIAVASIMAKVYRDNLMSTLAEKYPAFLWHKNAGYGTKEHLRAIAKYGITKHHRKSFAPIKSMFNNNKSNFSKME